MNFSRRLLIYVLACSAVFSLVASGVQLYLSYRSDLSNIDQNISYIEESYLPTIARSVYAFDIKQLQLQLEGGIRLQGITAMSVDDNSGDNNSSLSIGSHEP